MIVFSHSHSRILSYWRTLVFSYSRSLVLTCSRILMLPRSRDLVRLSSDALKLPCCHALMLLCSCAIVLSCSHALVRLQTRSYISIDCSLRSTYIPLSIADERAKRASKAVSCCHTLVLSYSLTLSLSHSKPPTSARSARVRPPHAVMLLCLHALGPSCPRTLMFSWIHALVLSHCDALSPSSRRALVKEQLGNASFYYFMCVLSHLL